MEFNSDLVILIKKLFGESGGRVDSHVDIKSVLAEKAMRLNPIAIAKARTDLMSTWEFEGNLSIFFCATQTRPD